MQLLATTHGVGRHTQVSCDMCPNGIFFSGICLYQLVGQWPGYAVKRLQKIRNSSYRATRTHSADYAVVRCLSVCPSHAGIVCKRLYISSNFFHHFSPTISAFPHQTGWQYSGGDPLTGASNAMVYEQEAQLSRRDRATLRVIEYFAKSFKVTQGHSKWHCWVVRL